MKFILIALNQEKHFHNHSDEAPYVFLKSFGVWEFSLVLRYV